MKILQRQLFYSQNLSPEKKINEKIGHEFEREQRVVYWRAWREESEGRNVSILQSQI